VGCGDSAIAEKPTEPAAYRQIFERGIDPDVDDPSLCHDHSEIPEAWPHVDEILAFQSRVRERVNKLYESGFSRTDQRTRRALWIGFEHEAMHLETLLYMLVQSERINPPPGTIYPDFEALAQISRTKSVPNEWFDIPEMDVLLGMNDPENDFGPDRYFGWDNEKPTRSAHVKAFQAKGRPITNQEYAEYLDKTGKSDLPASWCDTPYLNGSGTLGYSNGYTNGINDVNGTNSVNVGLMSGKYVRTVYGAVPLKYAADWPVVASYDELVGCAQWMGGRIPTMEEVRAIYRYVEHSKVKEFEQSLANNIPAVNRCVH
jgi:formylglycine-generating enzyme required for sulfatase activity